MNSSANAAYSTAQQIVSDLGVNGQSPSAYDKIKELEAYIKEIQTAALGLGDKQDATSDLAQKIVGMITDVLNEQAKQTGLDNASMLVETLTSKQAKDAEAVDSKLEELMAKIRAIQEAMKVDDMVIKSWWTDENEGTNQ